MACGSCGGYYGCHCDLVEMKEQARVKRLEAENLEFKIEKEAKKRLKGGEYKSSLIQFLGDE